MDLAAKIITLESLEKREMSFFSKNSNVMILAPVSPFLVFYLGMRVFPHV